MQTLAARRRSGREAQARYAARLREAGVPTRLQVLGAIEAGVEAVVVEVLGMEDGPAKVACVKLLETLLKGSLACLDADDRLDRKASRQAISRLLIGSAPN